MKTIEIKEICEKHSIKYSKANLEITKESDIENKLRIYAFKNKTQEAKLFINEVATDEFEKLEYEEMYNQFRYNQFKSKLDKNHKSSQRHY